MQRPDLNNLAAQHWDKAIKEHHEKIENQELKRTLEIETQEQKEQNWELVRMCRIYLEENDKQWAERRKKEEHKMARTTRLEETGIMGRKAKLDQLRKNR